MSIPPFPLDQAKQAIANLNDNEEAISVDRVVHHYFARGGKKIEAGSIADQVVVLDKLWATQMFRRPGHTSKVINSIREHIDILNSECESLAPDALEHQPDRVAEAAIRLLPIVMALDESPASHSYAPYSFASKFLHWTTRHHFPIVDHRARGAIRKLYTGRTPPPVHSESSGSQWREDYPKWIEFYSKLIRALPQSTRDQLLQHDLNSQVLGERCENSLLRVLDKALYWGLGQGPNGADRDPVSFADA